MVKVCGQEMQAAWSREDAKTLLDSIAKDSVSGLRDLALEGSVIIRKEGIEFESEVAEACAVGLL
jgi:hypothetical protein